MFESVTLTRAMISEPGLITRTERGLVYRKDTVGIVKGKLTECVAWVLLGLYA